MEIAEYWIKFGIDGWRLDVPFEIKTPGFWQEFRDRVKAINPEAYIVGEVWEDAREWLDGTQFDGVMNYLFAAPTIAFTAGDRVVMEQVQDRSYQPYPPLFAKEYGEKIQAVLEMYPWEIQLTQLNLLASHDTARLLSIAGGDRDSVKLATLLLLTYPGAPSIYYGDEVGLPGALDPDSRRAFPMADKWEQDVLTYHRQLIALRHQFAALRTGRYQVVHAESTTYVFARILGGEEIVVAVNVGTAETKTTIDWATTGLRSRPDQLLFGEATVEWETAEVPHLTLHLPARSGCILAAQS